MKKRKLNYIFHNPNTPEATADYILKLFIEANASKVEAVIRQAVGGNHHHIKQATFCVRHHTQELLAVFDFCAGDTLVSIQAHQIITCTLGVFREKLFLCFQTV